MELRDPLHAVQYAGHRRKSGARTTCLITLTLFFAGRFIGTLLMSKFRPAVLLAIFAAADVALCVAAALAGGDVGLYALMATSFFMSIQFPTIFTMSLRGLGTHTKSGSSFLVMAIVGGAVIPPLMGLVSDASTINLAMLIPAMCFAVVFLFAWVSRREQCRPQRGRCMTRRSRGASWVRPDSR